MHIRLEKATTKEHKKTHLNLRYVDYEDVHCPYIIKCNLNNDNIQTYDRNL